MALDAELARTLSDEIFVSLSALERALEQVDADKGWVERLDPILRAEVARLRERLSEDDGDVRTRWQLLTEIENRVERLASEALQFVGGVGARAAGIDGGSCKLADCVLAEVASRVLALYQPITLPSASEYVDVLSEVIRVRYPGRGLWDLPIVLHEFGHYLVERLRITQGGASPSSLIERERAQKPYLGFFAEELWADTFATYVGGPAYAASALTRFDPASANRDRKPTHPAPAKRSQAILLTLKRSQRAWEKSGRAAGSLATLIDLVDRFWRAACVVLGAEVAPSDGDAAYVRGLVDEYLQVLDREVVAARFDNAQHAAQVRRSLTEGEDPPTGCSLVDTLNGAWWSRLLAEAEGRPDKIPALSIATTDMCARIQHSGGNGP